jgi:Skp family chaperone for outer membrane proteins
VKRLFLGIAAVATIGAAAVVFSQAQAQQPTTPTAPSAGGGAPGGAAPTRTDSPRVAVFNVAKLMNDFKKWQYYAVVMDNQRKTMAAELVKAKNQIVRMQESYEKEPEQAKRDQLAKAIRDARNAFEDREKVLKDTLDAEVNKHLKELFQDITLVVTRIAEVRDLDIVFAYPEALNAKDAESQLYIDSKMRPQGGVPFYVSKRNGVDITDLMLATLNEHRKPPAEIPAAVTLDKDGNVVTTGATTPGNPR